MRFSLMTDELSAATPGNYAPKTRAYRRTTALICRDFLFARKPYMKVCRMFWTARREIANGRVARAIRRWQAGGQMGLSAETPRRAAPKEKAGDGCVTGLCHPSARPAPQRAREYGSVCQQDASFGAFGTTDQASGRGGAQSRQRVGVVEIDRRAGQAFIQDPG